jgi:hypothetical protein
MPKLYTPGSWQAGCRRNRSRDLFINGRLIYPNRSGIPTEIIRLLIAMVPQQRQSGTVREERATYGADIDRFLNDVPMP